MDAHQQLIADVFDKACPSRDALEHVTGRWGILAMMALTEGTFRFNALRRRVEGISEKMLSQTLQALERDGFVHREAQPVIPPKVEYSLTPLGEQTAEKLFALVRFVEDRLPEIVTARQEYDKAKG